MVHRHHVFEHDHQIVVCNCQMCFNANLSDDGDELKVGLGFC